MVWVGLGLSLIPGLDENFVRQMLDDDFDNFAPRLIIVFWCILAYGAYQSLCGRPWQWIKQGFLALLAAIFVLLFTAPITIPY